MGFRTVFVKNGDRLNLKLDNLEVTKSTETFTIPLFDIENIILEGDYTVITSRLLAKLAKFHISVIVCDNHYLPCGQFLGFGQYHRSAKRAAWQASWTEVEKGNSWTEVVSNKIRNQITVAEKLKVATERIELMDDLLLEIGFADSTNREGHVAKVYFNSLFGMGFSREDNILPNHCLNYGYSIIRGQMARCVVSLGLLPMLGIFHRNEYNSYNLVDDLMEPFRPLMDFFVLTEILNDDVEFLTYEIRLTLINFLNHKMMIKGKKIYMSQVMLDYVQSFIKAIEKNDYSLLMKINFEDYLGCDESEI